MRISKFYFFLLFAIISFVVCDKKDVDETPPTIVWNNFEWQDTVFSGLVEISVIAQDDNNLKSVTLFADAEKFALHLEESIGIYNGFLNTTAFADGDTIPIWAVATDEAKNNASTDTLKIAVNNLDLPPLAVEFDTVRAISGSEIRLVWQSSRDKDFKEFNLFRAQVQGINENDAPIETTTDTVFTDSGLDSSTVYWYRLGVVLKSGETSLNDADSARTHGRLPFHIWSEEVKKYSATVRWSGDESPAFKRFVLGRNFSESIEISDSVFSTKDKDMRYFDDDSLNQSTRYYYKIFEIDMTDSIRHSAITGFETKKIQPAQWDESEIFVVSDESIHLGIFQSEELDFQKYELWRDSTAAFLTPQLVEDSYSIQKITYLDDNDNLGLTPYDSLFYRVSVYDLQDSVAHSEILPMFTNIPPYPVTMIDTALDLSWGHITVGWSQNSDWDFARYVICRAENPFVAIEDSVGFFAIQDSTIFRDETIGSGVGYYYRVFVRDLGGLATGADETTEEIRSGF